MPVDVEARGRAASANEQKDRVEQVARISGSDLHVDERHPYFLHYRSLFADIQKASTRASGRMLDVGCGNKPFANTFREYVSEHIGCDVVQSSESRADILCLATSLPFKDASYDTVLITQVIEHVADHRALLQEAFRVLKTGGVLIVSGPMYWPLHEEPYDFFRFTKYGMQFLLEGSGFSEIEIVNDGGHWALCGQVLIHTISVTRLARFGLLVRAINRVFAWLDDRRPTSDNPINYLAVARKPAF
jgi:SAM-dependent methyltransferase